MPDDDAFFTFPPDSRHYPLIGLIALVAAYGPTAADVPSKRQPPLRGQALLQWFEQQPRTVLPTEFRGAPVVVASFVDYQCPACLSGKVMLEPLFAELAEKFGPTTIKFIELDFPLERECNGPDAPNLHPGACEAAAMMKMARANRDPRDAQMAERWLFANQATLDTESVFHAARELLGIFDVERQYPVYLGLVRAEIEVGRVVGVRATPRYWINGVLTPLRPAEDMKLLIEHEVAKSQTNATAR